MKLTEDALSSIYTQDYTKKTNIEGVRIIPLRRFNDAGGSLTELARLSSGELDGIESFKIAQINYSELEAGGVKAFHIHEFQTDIWFVPPSSKMLLVLVDQREASPTLGVMMKQVLGDCNSQLVLIPPGIAHGCKNLAQHLSTIIYFVNRKFSVDLEDCDEKRLPWDFWGEDLWEMPKE